MRVRARMNEVRMEGQWCGPCSICGAVAWERWPHPEGEPCPQKVKVDDAYIMMLDAQRMAYLRTGVAAEGVHETFRRRLEGDP